MYVSKEKSSTLEKVLIGIGTFVTGLMIDKVASDGKKGDKYQK